MAENDTTAVVRSLEPILAPKTRPACHVDHVLSAAKDRSAGRAHQPNGNECGPAGPLEKPEYRPFLKSTAERYRQLHKPDLPLEKSGPPSGPIGQPKKRAEVDLLSSEV